eukprot:Ihof_evm3s153 gene=Ihof_evmTU3s153
MVPPETHHLLTTRLDQPDPIKKSGDVDGWVQEGTNDHDQETQEGGGWGVQCESTNGESSWFDDNVKQYEGAITIEEVNIPVLEMGQSLMASVKVNNIGYGPQTIASATVLEIKYNSFKMQPRDFTLPFELMPNESCYFDLECIGTSKAIHVGLISLKTPPFTITQTILLRVVANKREREEIESLIPKIAYEQTKRKTMEDEPYRIVPGTVKAKDFKQKNNSGQLQLPAYRYPPRFDPTEYKGMKPLGPYSTAENYEAHGHVLLWLEEMQMENDIHEFSLQDISMTKVKNRYKLYLPGLSERRPSVLYGDTILAQRKHQHNGVYHKGVVMEVGMDHVLLEFLSRFDDGHDDSSQYNVRFTIARSGLQTMHLGLERMRKSRIPIVPLSHKAQPSVMRSRVYNLKPFFNKKLNIRQKIAIENVILSNTPGYPYFLFGPPGTGKTTVVAEIISQVIRQDRYTRILVCAPSNSACDLITTLLSESVDVQQLLRLNAYTREMHGVPETVLKYSYIIGDHFEIPPVDLLAVPTVIVATCASAGKILRSQLDNNHFGFVLIDEAGQALEQEVLIPLMVGSGHDTRTILVGDPRQLGPVVRSTMANRGGLGTSMIERLMVMPIYSRNIKKYPMMGYNPMLVCKLTDNYRSHPLLLSTYSRLFYDNELVPCAKSSIANIFVGWEGLPNKDVPFIFLPVRGKEERESGSPSWFNVDEVLAAVNMVEKILKYRKSGVKAREIGIITAYRKMVSKIRSLLARRRIIDVTVGSVEEFQGSERKVIILCTVRSKLDYIETDLVHNIGFLGNPRRFNVAISRAQSLLVVIGNPIVLQHDKYWSQLITFAAEHRAYPSDSFFDFQAFLDRAKILELTERMDNVSLDIQAE